jgi:hypothetical protein
VDSLLSVADCAVLMADKVAVNPIAWALKLLKDSGHADAANMLVDAADAAGLPAVQPSWRVGNDGTLELSTCEFTGRVSTRVEFAGWLCGRTHGQHAADVPVAC